MVLKIDNETIDYAMLLDNLSFLDDWEDRYSYIMELGKKLEPFPEAFKNENFRVKGCVSQVWVYPNINEQEQVFFQGDSDSQLVKGLIAVVFIIYNYLTKSEIQTIDFQEKFTHLGLSEHLSPQRSNGLFSLVQKINEFTRL